MVQALYYELPLFARSIGYFVFRYVFLLRFLDGLPGLVYHSLHGGWYRFIVDTYIWMRDDAGATDGERGQLEESAE